MSVSYTVVIKSNSVFNSDVTCTRFPEYTYDDSPKEDPRLSYYLPWCQTSQGLTSDMVIEELLFGHRTPIRNSGEG